MSKTIKRLVPYDENVYRKLKKEAKRRRMTTDHLAQIYIEEGMCWNDRSRASSSMP